MSLYLSNYSSKVSEIWAECHNLSHKYVNGGEELGELRYIVVQQRKSRGRPKLSWYCLLMVDLWRWRWYVNVMEERLQGY